MEKFWPFLKKILLFIGKVQTILLLTLIYYLIITPFGILSQLYSLVTKKKPTSYWSKREKNNKNLADFYKQY